MCVYIYNVSDVYMILWVIMQKKMGSKRLGSGLFMTLQTGRHQRRQAIAHGLILVGTHLASWKPTTSEESVNSQSVEETVHWLIFSVSWFDSGSGCFWWHFIVHLSLYKYIYIYTHIYVYISFVCFTPDRCTSSRHAPDSESLSRWPESLSFLWQMGLSIFCNTQLLKNHQNIWNIQSILHHLSSNMIKQTHTHTHPLMILITWNVHECTP